MSTAPSQRDRFVRALDELGIPVEWPLAVASAVGMENVFLGASTLGGPLQLLVPVRPALVVLLAPGATLPERSMLLVSVDREERVSTAAVIGGPVTVRQAVDEVAPASARNLWYPLMDSLGSNCGGTIRNRSRQLGHERGTITVAFPSRTIPEQARLGEELARLATRLGVSDAWRRAYDDAGPGADLSVTTACTPEGPSAYLGLRFGPASWDRTIDLAKAMLGTERARDAAVRMGMLAGGLRIDGVRGVDAVFEHEACDLIVWLQLG